MLSVGGRLTTSVTHQDELTRMTSATVSANIPGAASNFRDYSICRVTLFNSQHTQPSISQHIPATVLTPASQGSGSSWFVTPLSNFIAYVTPPHDLGSEPERTLSIVTDVLSVVTSNPFTEC